MNETIYAGFRIEYSEKGYSIFMSEGGSERRIATVRGIYVAPTNENFKITDYRAFANPEEALDYAKSSINSVLNRS